MNKNRMMAAAQAVNGMTYMEWRMLVEEVEREFQRKLSTSTITAEDAEGISARMEIMMDMCYGVKPV